MLDKEFINIIINFLKTNQKQKKEFKEYFIQEIVPLKQNQTDILGMKNIIEQIKYNVKFQ